MKPLTLISLLLVFGVAAASPTDEDFLAALCKNKPVELVSTNQLGALVNFLGSPTCPNHVKDAIAGLDELVKEGSGDLCSMRKVNAIKDYYNRHLYKSKPASEKLIPKRLERLALAYAMQVNSECKVNMVRQLLSMGSDHLTEEDFRALDSFTYGPIGQLLSGMTKPDEITYPSDYLWILPSKGTETIQLQEHKSTVSRAKLFCDRRFKPIYKPLIEPVKALSDAGFDSIDALFMLFEPRYVESVIRGTKRWSRYVLTCEMLELVDVMDPPVQVDHLEPEQIEVNPEPSGPIGTILINKYDKRLIRALKQFDTSKSEMEHAQDRRLKLTLEKLAPVFESQKMDLSRFAFIDKQIIELLKDHRQNSRGILKGLSKSLELLKRSPEKDSASTIMKDIFKETGMTRKEIDEIRESEFISLGLAP